MAEVEEKRERKEIREEIIKKERKEKEKTKNGKVDRSEEGSREVEDLE